MTWIKGEKILERPSWGLDQDLIDAYGEWGLSPYREIDGARMTRSSKCFNCKRANKDYLPGRIDEHGGSCLPLQWSSLRQGTGGLRIPRSAPSYASAKELDPELAEHFFATGEFVFDAGSIDTKNARLFRFLTAMVGEDAVEHLMLENACDKCERMSPFYMSGRLKAAKFRLKDVEAYEKANGMWQPEEEHDVASRQRLAQAKEDERQQTLLDLALGYVRERGVRITNDELLKFLCQNSKEEVSVRAAKEVWKMLPLESRKGAGRPKKEI